MKPIELRDRSDLSSAAKSYDTLRKLIVALGNKSLTPSVVDKINIHVSAINDIPSSDPNFVKIIKQRQSAIVKMLERELNIVPKNYYRNVWLAIGMASFGLPIGIAFGTSVGNLGLLGVGIPVGMAIGIAIGTQKDRKAFEENRQLDMELR